MGTPIWSTLDRRGEYDRPEIVGADQLQWGGGMGGMGASIGSPLPQTRRGRVFEISVGRGEQSKILKVAVLKKSISKTDVQFKTFNFWSPAPQCTFESSGAPKGSIFWRTVWPGDAGFDFLRARFAPAPEGSKFPSGVSEQP